ncbi:hypothetical protein CCACVL1_17331 [Corchorus capsularis]|uniref:Uncharacterized protein n=1 Tax=Corchorus capsularis TaxID=210143 RepID=A0A1R3HSL7_COCAP|nr:hypothetical protein CCACVL1_17331 [Corchorus capsularis]
MEIEAENFPPLFRASFSDSTRNTAMILFQ